MIRHIKSKGIMFLLLLISLSCSGNILLDEANKDESIVVQDNRQLGKYTFFKSFQFCDNPIGAFTQEEADQLYSTKEIDFKDTQKIGDLDWESFFYEGAKECVEAELGVKHTSSIVLSTNDNFPFEQIVLFNSKFLLVAQDGFFFVFKKKKIDETSNGNSTIKGDDDSNLSKNNLKPIFQALEKKKAISLPLEYSYEFISELKNFTAIDQQNVTELDYLSDFQFAKLSSKDGAKLLLVSGLMENGQSELHLFTVNNAFEKVGALLLYTSEETEDGSISTRFKISKNQLVTIIKEEKGNKTSRIIEEKSYQISSTGNFVTVK